LRARASSVSLRRTRGCTEYASVQRFSSGMTPFHVGLAVPPTPARCAVEVLALPLGGVERADHLLAFGPHRAQGGGRESPAAAPSISVWARPGYRPGPGALSRGAAPCTGPPGTGPPCGPAPSPSARPTAREAGTPHGSSRSPRSPRPPRGRRPCRAPRPRRRVPLTGPASAPAECPGGPGRDALGSQAVVHVVGHEQAEAGVRVLLGVPAEEVAAEAPGVLDTAEALGEVRPGLQRLDVRLPNPIRALDNSLTPGQAVAKNMFFNVKGTIGLFTCHNCHHTDLYGNAEFGVPRPGFFGADGRSLLGLPGVGGQSIKVPQLRNLYQKVGIGSVCPRSRLSTWGRTPRRYHQSLPLGSRLHPEPHQPRRTSGRSERRCPARDDGRGHLHVRAARLGPAHRRRP